MTDVIDLELGDDIVKKPIDSKRPNQSSKTKVKRRGQLTFDDFRNIKVTEEPVVFSHNVSIDDSLDAAIQTNKHNKDEKIDDEEPPSKKLKGNAKHEHSNIKAHPNEVIKAESNNENIINNRPLYTLNWSPNIPLQFLDYRKPVGEDKAVENKWAPPNCIPLPYAGDIIKVLSFIAKFHWAFGDDLLNLSFQEVEIGLELQSNLHVAYVHSLKDVKLCQDKMNLLFCSILKLLFNPDKGTENHTHKNFTLQRFLNLKNPYGKLVRKLKAVMQEWGCPEEWRNNDDSLSTLNLNGRGLLTMKPSARIILLRCMIDWSCSYSPLFHNEIQRLSHLKGDTGFNHQTFHTPRLSMYGVDDTLNNFEVLCSLMNQKLENRKKRRSHDQDKLSEINEQMKFLKDVRKSLNEKLTADRLRATIKINEQWSKYFENELSHTPVDDPIADEIYRLRSSEFMIARIPKLGDFYLPPFRIENKCNATSTTYNFNKMTTYVNYYIKFKKEDRVAPKQLAASIPRENTCQLKLLYNDTSVRVHDLLSSDTKLAKASHWFEVSGDLESLIGFIEYLERAPLLEESTGADTKKGIDNLIEYLKVFIVFISETIKITKDTTTQSIVGRHLRTKSRQRARTHYSADGDSDCFEETETEFDKEFNDNCQSEYFCSREESEKTSGNGISECLKAGTDNENNNQSEDYSDVEIFSEPVRQMPSDSREGRSLRRNARRDLSF
ncbi:Esc8p [Saccharomyces eubayanus]|uniref:Esc8p n=1 Tax=Saccharomyces eubayanus TaxID=1080349 RepID=UPI0006C1F0F1|nr:ESC8-like protein [Saccharomyces eubayanus]KOG99050.1 ESC8-like protein [Saccharomyces eubayanus]